DIVNMSLGSTVYSKALREQVQKTYNAGVAIFASAGNGIYNEDAGMNYGMPTTTNPSYPGADSNCIGVMAIDKTDPTQLSVFSNYDNLGGFYDVAAPGVAIVGCVAGSGIGAMSGTSQATPLVAACAALYLSIYPTVTNAQLYAAVRNSPTRTVTSNQTVDPGCTATFKILDAVELLEYGAVKPEINVNYSTSCTLDNNRGYIYGLDERYTDITNYVTVTPGTGTMLLVRTAIGYGTGSVLNIYKKSGELYRSYQVIIFGDLNGDTIADGCDAVVLSCILDDPTAYEDNIKFAADVSFDDVVTELDREYIFNYAIGLESIFQSR
ncbi:MAG: S8 family serine peptidase, partial [Clostridia bacterium]|nr:S8 family serine peptidase [Clostridia bacterium]